VLLRDTRRLPELCTRNRSRHGWIDVVKASKVDAFLQRMRVPIADTRCLFSSTENC
jgi:hypothetical protein